MAIHFADYMWPALDCPSLVCETMAVTGFMCGVCALVCHVPGLIA